MTLSDDGDPAERDDGDGGTIDPLESLDTTGGCRHLPAHGRLGRRRYAEGFRVSG